VKQLVVTADDFGLCDAVNEAVEQAHTNGILSAASLMVAEDAAADAVARARRLPGLGVGLHLVLVDGKPMLPPDRVPDLVGPDGRFFPDPQRAGVRLYMSRAARDQARQEIRAQFAAFRATGLPLDHVNAHHHFHLHPTVQALLLEIAREQKLPPVRIPLEPPGARLDRWLAWGFHALRLRALRRQLRAAGVLCNDACFGIWDSGRLDAARLQALIAALPDGISEIYCHPATARPAGVPDSYHPATELAALRDRGVADTMARAGLRPVRFGDLVPNFPSSRVAFATREP
jgi:hopanoid biosynthesis associated protein HpnK